MILKEEDLSIILSVEHRNQEVSDMKFSPGRLFTSGFKRKSSIFCFR
jgi:hypothetical protein